jgi:quercetin dioxygenase-like cupin family protein
MANVGDTLDNGNFKMTLVRTSASTSGAAIEVEALYGPHSQPPPRHYHPRQEEEFRILDGQLTFALGSEQRVITAGNALIVPTGVIHQAWNPNDAPARVSWTTRPALKTEHLFEAVAAVARARKEGKKPSVLQLALLAREFSDEFVLASPPRLVQTCVFGLLASVARAFGIKRPGAAAG